MSLKSQAISPVPAETARIARAAYPKGNVSMQMREVLGSIYTDSEYGMFAPPMRHAALGIRHADKDCEGYIRISL
jgi:transposase